MKELETIIVQRIYRATELNEEPRYSTVARKSQEVEREQEGIWMITDANKGSE